MTELLTAAQMRAIEKAAIDSGQVTGLELMERAGRGVVEAIFEEWPELKATSHRAVVLCGPGNNGGDGFVVARLLKEWGWEVEVFLYGDPERMPPDARVNYERWRMHGGTRRLSQPTVNEDEAECFRHLVAGTPDTKLIVDALFGIGLTRPIPGLVPILAATDLYPQDEDGGMPPKVVAVDVPSGLSADTGAVLSDDPEGADPWDVVQADLTVTFHSLKPGHLLGDGLRCCGKVRVAPIGLSLSGLGEPKVGIDHALTLTAVEPLSRRLPKRPHAHKYSHGHALILSGPAGRGGAARLSARGALRIGAGVVTVGCPQDAIPENAARLDAVMLRGVADGAALAQVLEDKRINALCLGPGMGTGAREAGLLVVALAEKNLRPMVLDADALTLLSLQPEVLAALPGNCVLTPHGGEFARLFPDIAAKLAEPATKGPAYSKVDATREAAKRAGCVVLFKGPDTVIAGPNGRCAINSAHYDRAAPWLATAGSGDVLAGFITGLLARGFAAFDAACTSAWLHVECARSFGPGLIAEDLPEELPKVFRALGL